MANNEKRRVGQEYREPEPGDHIRAIQSLANRVAGRAGNWRETNQSEASKLTSLEEVLSAVDLMHVHATLLRERELDEQQARKAVELAAHAIYMGEATVRLLIPKAGIDNGESDEFVVDSMGLVPSQKYESAATPRTVMARRTGLTAVKTVATLDQILGENEYEHYGTRLTVINLLARPISGDTELQPGHSWQTGFQDQIRDLTIPPKETSQ